MGYRQANLTVLQEFSIEIPDKEADAIHSGMSSKRTCIYCILMTSQSSKQWTTSWLSPMVSCDFTTVFALSY
jgi:hypothetical protein